MGFEVLIILFLVFSVVSSMINKVQESRRRQKLEEEKGRPRHRQTPAPVPEEEIDLSEWEIFSEVEQPKPKPQEFREVRGTRRVSEADTGEEFQEVRGTRPVEEVSTGEEFQEVRGKRTVTESFSVAEGESTWTEPKEEELSEQAMPTQRRKRRRVQLDFKRNALQKAIIYQEILGPPVSERAPY